MADDARVEESVPVEEPVSAEEPAPAEEPAAVEESAVEEPGAGEVGEAANEDVEAPVAGGNETQAEEQQAEAQDDAASMEGEADEAVTEAAQAEAPHEAPAEAEQATAESLSVDEQAAELEAAAPEDEEPQSFDPLTMMENFRSKYLTACELYGCAPVPLLQQQLDANIKALMYDDGTPHDSVVLNGNSGPLFGSRISPKQVYSICDALQATVFVTLLDLSYNFLDDSAATGLSALLRANPTLQRLDLTGNAISATGVALLCDELALRTEAAAEGSGRGLETLQLSGNPLGDEGGLAVAAMLRKNRSLRRLTLSGTDLGMRAVCAIGAALQEENVALQALDMSNCLAVSCKDEPALWFARVLAAHKSLSALSLARWRMKDSGLETLVQYGLLRNARMGGRLQYLDLSSNSLTEESGGNLARLLAANTAIATLNLACNALHDNAAVAMAEALPRCSTLASLDLSFNGINDSALQSLAFGLRQNRSVAVIRLWGNAFGFGASAAFGQLFREEPGRFDADFECYVVDGQHHVAKVAASDDNNV